MAPPQQLVQKSIRGRYESILKHGADNPGECAALIKDLRQLIASTGLPLDSNTKDSNGLSLRGNIWKILLGMPVVDAYHYIDLIKRGPSEVYSKIRDDTCRTLKTDEAFHAAVSEDVLIRTLNSFAHEMSSSSHVGSMNSLKFSYVQGMNVLVAPMLFVMPELDAFYCFSELIVNRCPMYVQPALAGVHAGMRLFGRCLAVIDREVDVHLNFHNLQPNLYTFGPIMTLSCSTPPLSEVLKLWDFLLAFGVHLNVLCVLAHVLTLRKDILQSTSPMKLLRTLPSVNASVIIPTVLRMIPLLPDDIYDELVRHPFQSID